MSIIQLLHNRFLTRNDIINSSVDKCILCFFVYCCLPFIEASTNNHSPHDESPQATNDYNDYPENFFHMTLD